jgi:outer membrane lipoprotein carrier protein
MVELSKLFPKLFLALALVTAPAIAADSVARVQLQRFFDEVTSFQGDFTQVLHDENGDLVEENSGRVYLQRPGKFKWDYAPPSAQLIVSDGKEIVIYDSELEQVTIRSFESALAQVPTLVLVDGDANLEAHFDVIDIGPEGGLEWVAVRPLDDDASYEELSIGFRGGRLAGIHLLDGLGQVTRLMFTASEENAELDADTFSFVPPEGVDVLRYE